MSRGQDTLGQQIPACVVIQIARVGYGQQRDVDWAERRIFIERQFYHHQHGVPLPFRWHPESAATYIGRGP